jgi:hypothetical protein
MLKKEHFIAVFLFSIMAISVYLITANIKKEECKINKDCEPNEFSIDNVGKFYICENRRCITKTSENLENINCQNNDDCPYGYDCENGSCQASNPETTQPQFTSCQMTSDCPEGDECVEGRCWGPE